MNELTTLIQLRSNEEKQFLEWIREAEEKELISSWAYEPESYELIPKTSFTKPEVMKTKIKNKDRHLHEPLSYTPDWYLEFTPRGVAILNKYFEKSIYSAKPYNKVYIDVKGTYNPHQKDPRFFTAMQKLMYMVYSIYPLKVVPDILFKHTWCPEPLRWIRNRKKPTLTKRGRQCKTIAQYIKDVESDPLYTKRYQHICKILKHK